MNGYVEGGYVVVLTSLGGYGASLVVRLRAARRRLAVPAIEAETGEPRPAREEASGAEAPR